MEPMEPARLGQIIAEVSELGDHFHLFTAHDGPGWRSLSELLSDRDALEARILATAEAYRTTELRVAASSVYQDLAARLWFPVLGAAVLHRTVLDWTPTRLSWRASAAGPLPLRLSEPRGMETNCPEDTAEPLYRAMARILQPLADLTRAVVKVSPRLLWGNAASSLTGVVGVIAHERPSHAREAIALGDRLLGLGDGPGTGHQTEPVAGHPFFTRTTCCLNYRIPDAGNCDDCVLLAPGSRQERWLEAVRAERAAPDAHLRL
ncbi:ferric iron reductase [Streptomyces sp. SID13666]|uniref:(2Fe-2S)-binding protein n=1 Tax=Streptomyces sp. SID13666 TaxID=2706054 RepID=UPI0013C0ABFE|nr:(2Fe-2S)-binding protein [Streptomyces sp. SID13666]NEA54751.1 ferric iron reductase [Streptomyces sp. SID13666]